MNGKFYKKSCDEIIKTEYNLNKDSTLYSVYNFGNYELLLGNGYHISIGIDKSSCECLSVCCLLDALPFKKIKMDFLNDTYEQYDLIYGEYPSAYNEIVLIVDGNNEISDIVLYSLGLKTTEEMREDLENECELGFYSSQSSLGDNSNAPL